MSNLDYTPRRWQVHTLGNRVALHTGNGATAYMTAEEARVLARTLNDAAAAVGMVADFPTATGQLTGREP